MPARKSNSCTGISRHRRFPISVGVVIPLEMAWVKPILLAQSPKGGGGGVPGLAGCQLWLSVSTQACDCSALRGMELDMKLSVQGSFGLPAQAI